MPDLHKPRITMNKTLRLQCFHCGTDFLSGSPFARWCSNACKQSAYRTRRDTCSTDPQLPLELHHQRPSGHDCRIWQGTAIQRRQSDGYVNATAMAKANGKHLPHYMANERTQEYIGALAAVVGIPTTAVTRTIQGGTPSLQGTWIHPRLAIDLARWISPAFAVWMDGWFLESMQRPAQPALATGIHVVAPSRREAFRMWNQTIASEFVACMSDVLPIGHNQPTPVLIHTHPTD
jgi:hypothetical protein